MLALGSEGEQFITTHGASTKTPTVGNILGICRPVVFHQRRQRELEKTRRGTCPTSTAPLAPQATIPRFRSNTAMGRCSWCTARQESWHLPARFRHARQHRRFRRTLIGPITSNTIDDFAQQCGLSASSGSYELTTEATVHEYGETTNETDAVVYTTNAFAGYQTVNGEKICGM